MKNILVLFAHPAFDSSRINRILIDGLSSTDHITFHDLYEAYPEMDIDVRHEQELALQHDIIVFHHPFYWYSTPAILKEWLDLVLEHGWAYGKEGKALKDKVLFNCITAGGHRQAYCEQGYNRFTVRQLLAPIEQSAYLCKMTFLPPFVVHGTHSISLEEVAKYKNQYDTLLSDLSNERMNLTTASKLNYLNDYYNKESGNG